MIIYKSLSVPEVPPRAISLGSSHSLQKHSSCWFHQINTVDDSGIARRNVSRSLNGHRSRSEGASLNEARGGGLVNGPSIVVTSQRKKQQFSSNPSCEAAKQTHHWREWGSLSDDGALRAKRARFWPYSNLNRCGKWIEYSTARCPYLQCGT